MSKCTCRHFLPAVPAKSGLSPTRMFLPLPSQLYRIAPWSEACDGDFLAKRMLSGSGTPLEPLLLRPPRTSETRVFRD